MIRFSRSLLALTLMSAIPGVFAQGAIEAKDYKCAELEQMVADAGKLRINAKNNHPHGSERVSERTFVRSDGSCDFFDDTPTQWRIYASGGAICEGLYICLPKPSYGPD